MRRIEISNFGPISNFKADLDKNFMILIGPQASGKSTICKMIFFCESIKNYLLEYANDEKFILKTNDNMLYINFLHKSELRP